MHPDAFGEFEEHAVANLSRQVLGDPLEASTSIGPNYGGDRNCRYMMGIVLDAKAKGARAGCLVRDEGVAWGTCRVPTSRDVFD